MATKYTSESFTITAPGGADTASVYSSEAYIKVSSSGTIVLAAGYTLSHSGVPLSNSKISVLYTGNTSLTTDTASGKSITLFGYTLTNSQAKLNLLLDFYWDGAAWNPYIAPSVNGMTGAQILESNMIVAGSITNTALKDGAVDLVKMDDISEGSILIGDNSNRPSALSIKTDKAIPIGNGTTSVPRVISGDLTISNTGVASIANGVVTEDMLAFSLGDISLLEFTISTEQVRALNSVPPVIIAAQGANTLIIPVEFWVFLDYATTTYTGGGTLSLQVGGVTLGSVASTTVTSASDLVTKFVLSTAVASGSLLNTDLTLTCATADFATGDSPLKCKLLYKVVTF